MIETFKILHEKYDTYPSQFFKLRSETVEREGNRSNKYSLFQEHINNSLRNNFFSKRVLKI